MQPFDLSDPRVNANPFPAFARLRAEDPVHWSPPMKAWIITRYDDVRRIALNNSEISADRLTPFFAAAPARQGGIENLIRYLNHWMVFRDPPGHTRLRRLFSKAFTPGAVEALRPNVEGIVELLLDEMDAKAAAGKPLDFIADFAYPLPATVIMDMLGVPRADLLRVRDWSDEIALFIGTAQTGRDKYARAEAGAKAMADYFRGLVAERAAAPRDDMVSRLAAARDERDAMSADETISSCILLLFAGHETTTHLIANGFYHTMRRRDQWERIKGDPALGETAVEEWLRYDGPAATLARVVAADIEFGGKSLKRGQRIFAFLNSANRDPEQFADADDLDLGRSPNPHLAFGHGIHYCLGAPLARLETRIALGRLAERFPDICLAGGEPEWNDSLILRGMKSLPVALG